MDGVDGDGVQLLEGRSADLRENVGRLFPGRPEEADDAGGRGRCRRRGVDPGGSAAVVCRRAAGDRGPGVGEAARLTVRRAASGGSHG